MGKDNISAFDRATNSGKYGKALKRYGVEGVRYGRPGGESGYTPRTDADVDRDLKRAARNDYDTRRTLEAGAMSGKGKAKKILDAGFDDVGNILKAGNYMEKAAKRHGQGGDFSSHSDFMGLTQSMVERDRRKHNESIDDRVGAMKDSLLEQTKSKKEEPEAPVKLSDRAQAAKDFESYEFSPMASDSNTIFSGATNEQVEGGTIDFSSDSGKAYDPTKGESSPEAGAFLANRKADYKEGMKRAGVTGRGAGSLNF